MPILRLLCPGAGVCCWSRRCSPLSRFPRFLVAIFIHHFPLAYLQNLASADALGGDVLSRAAKRTIRGLGDLVTALLVLVLVPRLAGRTTENGGYAIFPLGDHKNYSFTGFSS